MGFFTPDKIFPKKRGRLLVLFAVLVAVFIGAEWYRWWRPTSEITTAHYVIRSSASAEQTQKIGEEVEILYNAYVNVFTNFPTLADHKMQLRLFKDRDEFKRINRGSGWAEAFYQEPYCNAYYSADEPNPYHWMLHEATHQLNKELEHFNMPKWENEGVATYFSTSLIRHGKLTPGDIDVRTYPVWWTSDMELTGDIQKDIASNQIIPLRAIVSGQGGPPLDANFNLYYIHWWSLSHFLFHYDNGKYRAGYFKVIREGGTLESFEKSIGPIETIQGEWYGHLRKLTKVY